MNDDEQYKLIDLVNTAEIAYRHSWLPDHAANEEFVAAKEGEVVAYVNGLLAAKEAEIAALKAQQVTEQTMGPRIPAEIIMLYNAHMYWPESRDTLPKGEIARLFLLHLFHALDAEKWPMKGDTE